MATVEQSSSLELQPTIALKWSGEIVKTQRAIITNLFIDPKRFFFICYDKFKNEAECFDLALIHDTRTGVDVSLPNGAECLDEFGFTVTDVSLSSRWLSIYYGNTYVTSDIRVVHFCFKTQGIAKEWTTKLFQLRCNIQLRHLSSLQMLEKFHTKIIYSLADSRKKIPVQNLIQYLCRNTRDMNKETTIRGALDYVKIPINKAGIDVEEFTFERFFRLYMRLIDPRDIDQLFESIAGKHRRHMNWENFKAFVKRQNDSIGMKYSEQKMKDFIQKYTHQVEHSNQNGMSEESFFRYLLSSDNFIFDRHAIELHMDMNKPLSHYLISSSHNTYLAGSQLIGRASIEMYRQVLLTGCRCIELDVVDSENDEPEIKHIYTPVKSVRFRDVLATIRDYAFKVTSYPLILSIENHCRAKAQARMAKYFVDLLGDYLLRVPLSTHPCEENYPLPSPNDLQYKILIKNKKLPPKSAPLSASNSPKVLPRPGTISNTSSSGQSSTDSSNTTNLLTSESRWYCDDFTKHLGKRISRAPKTPREGIIFGDEYYSDDEPPNSAEFPVEIRQAEATDAMSALVNYIVPTRFRSFALALERNLSYEMSSFPEEKAVKLFVEQARDFLLYNQRQLSRIYPRGTRVESSNFNPYLFWQVGCQMVALNYQTLDIPMQLNLALFSFNGACGYIEKPFALCRPRTSFDPRLPNPIEDVPSYQITLRVLSGQFLCQDREPTNVDIQLYGMYGQIQKRYEFRIQAKGWNGFRAIYDKNDFDSDEGSIQFSKIILPDLAALRFSVTAEDGAFLGQCFIPIAHLQTGYRYVPLKNQMNIPVNSSNLLIFIRKEVYLNPKEQELAEKLGEPLTRPISKSISMKKDFEDDYSHLLVRRHRPSIPNCATNFPESTTNIALEETDSYAKHFIVGSELNDRKRLCKVLSLSDIHPDEVIKRDKVIHNKLRRLSSEIQSSIKKEEGHLRERLDSSNSVFYRKLSASSLSANDQPKTPPPKNVEENLLKVYSKKFHQQQEFEHKQLEEYYKKLQTEIVDDYQRQLKQIEQILKKEKSNVEEYVRTQMKKDAILKLDNREKYTRMSQITIQKLEEMSAEVKQMLTMNLEINLIKLEEEKAKEIDKCVKKYSDGFHKIQLQLHHQIHTDDFESIRTNSSSD